MTNELTFTDLALHLAQRRQFSRAQAIPSTRKNPPLLDGHSVHSLAAYFALPFEITSTDRATPAL